MREELRRWLDGEARLAELPAEVRDEAEAWGALLADVRAAGPERAPAGLAERVLESIREPTPSWWRRAADWWVRPRPVPLSPAAGLAAAAAVAAALLLAPVHWGEPVAERAAPSRAMIGPAGPITPVRTAAATPGGPVYVQFLLRAPDARSVAVAGDFNDWSPDIALQDPDGDGTWSARVPMMPGLHEYMYVIDGTRWVTDPYAERYADDGFGNQNAILAISTPSGL